jgi:simple sugar transport system permease protein
MSATTATTPERPGILGSADRGARALLAARFSGSTAAVVGLTVVTVAAALGIIAALVVAVGGTPSDVFSSMFDGSFGSGSSFAQTLIEATPLLLVAVGSCISSRAGVFNIGQEGQLLIGAMLGGYVALRIAAPPAVVVILALVCSALGGALWAAIPAVMRYRRGVDVVVSTLLMIFLAQQLVTYVVSSPSILQEHVPTGQVAEPESDMLGGAFRLPTFGTYPHFTLGLGSIIALVLVIVAAVMLGRSRWGFRVRMLGNSPLAARHAGVREWLLGGAALALSGAFSGLAGGVILTGDVYRLQPAMSNDYGWDGLLVALIARDNPVACVIVAVVFGAVRAGGGLLASTGVPNYLVDIAQSLLVVAFVLPPALLAVWRAAGERRRGRAAASAASAATA